MFPNEQLPNNPDPNSGKRYADSRCPELTSRLPLVNYNYVIRVVWKMHYHVFIFQFLIPSVICSGVAHFEHYNFSDVRLLLVN